MQLSPLPVRGRLAPSPTGRLHLGNAVAFMLAFLFVRRHQGALALRMEDIDPDRSRNHFARGILDDLRWLGISWEEGPDVGGPFAPYTQSECLPAYHALLDQWLGQGLVYPCFCTRKELRTLASAPHVGDEGAPYPGTCRSLTDKKRESLIASGRRPSLRLHIERACAHVAGRPAAGGLSSLGAAFEDGIRGPQFFSWADIGGDFALRRSDGVIAYQLAVAMDDARMRITSVVRGDDLLSSTPRQILLHALLGNQPPCFSHVPLVHDHCGERLAKRHAALSLQSLRAAGVSPGAAAGYCAWMLGWLPRPESLSLEQLVPLCDFSRLRGRSLVLPPTAAHDLAALSSRSDPCLR